jgi:hypothetical protein
MRKQMTAALAAGAMLWNASTATATVAQTNMRPNVVQGLSLTLQAIFKEKGVKACPAPFHLIAQGGQRNLFCVQSSWHGIINIMEPIDVNFETDLENTPYQFRAVSMNCVYDENGVGSSSCDLPEGHMFLRPATMKCDEKRRRCGVYPKDNEVTQDEFETALADANSKVLVRQTGKTWQQQNEDLKKEEAAKWDGIFSAIRIAFR